MRQLCSNVEVKLGKVRPSSIAECTMIDSSLHVAVWFVCFDFCVLLLLFFFFSFFFIYCCRSELFMYSNEMVCYTCASHSRYRSSEVRASQPVSRPMLWVIADEWICARKRKTVSHTRTYTHVSADYSVAQCAYVLHTHTHRTPYNQTKRYETKINKQTNSCFNRQ